MPLTAITTVIGSITMLLSWLFITQRMQTNPGTATYQTRLLRNFFLFMAIFMLSMFLPHVTLNAHAEWFPTAMAYGYVIGHIFMYYSMLQVLRLFVSIVPRLNNKDRPVFAVGMVVMSVLTIVNAITMIGGTHPQFNTDLGVTEFNAHPAVGVGIALFALICLLPTAVLLIINGISNPPARARSFLLGFGLFIMMTGGPLHDNAHSAGLYIVADIVTILSVVVCSAGVAINMEQRLSVGRSTASASAN